MASNSLGKTFRISTWGESHGPMIGVTIDGCPANLEITESEIQAELDKRRPGAFYCSRRQEKDRVQIVSGVFEGKTTGAPITLIIANEDARSEDYKNLKQVYRPGHANFSYLKKYGIFDYRGGGRASARETACRVAAGAIAQKLLKLWNVELLCFLSQVGELKTDEFPQDEASLSTEFNCPEGLSPQVKALLEKVIEDGDSLSSEVTGLVKHLPAGVGEPVYEKLGACLAFSLFSIPAVKGVHFGEPLEGPFCLGSAYQDGFSAQGPASNRCGGILGGISTGEPLLVRVNFKPTSSIGKAQETTTLEGEPVQLKTKGRHDPCLGIRAVPVVKAMLALSLVDQLLGQSSHLSVPDLVNFDANVCEKYT